LHSLQGYRKTLSYEQVTTEFLNGYHLNLTRSGKSISTVGIYLRPLRAVYNWAILEGIIGAEAYPFGKGKYQIPSSQNIKKSLSKTDLKKLFEFSSEVAWEQRARDFFVFSYLANGMNMKDILLLKTSDIDGDFIRFNRAKTLRTSQSVLPISVPLTEEMKEIMSRCGKLEKTNQDYIFQLLHPEDNAERQRKKIQQFTKMVNKHLRIISVALGFSTPITTYFARHSFSTVLKNSGASIEFIGESLGHSSPTTTKRYLGSFDNSMKTEMAKVLTNFNT
jgi:site-specific recombinase XerD